MIEPWQILLLMLTGIIAGFLNVVAGGGSMITVPVMIFMGIPGPVANGTNRIAILAQNITAVITFCKSGYAEFRLSLTLALCALPGAVAGALLGTRLEGIWFNRVVAVIMLGVLLVMQFQRNPQAGNTETAGKTSPGNMVLGHLLMVLIGCFGGFIQIGVGFVFMPVLHNIMGMNLVRANMHKVFIIGTYTIAALFIFAARVEILWLTGLCLALGHSVGGWLGAHISISKGDKLIKRVLNGVLVIIIIKLLFF